MWKKLLAGVAVLLVILVALAWYLLAHLGLTIQASIEKNAAAATGTRVAISRVEVSLFTGICIISGLTVSNPPGFNTPYALSLGTITIRATTGSLLMAILAASGLWADLVAASELCCAIHDGRRVNVQWQRVLPPLHRLSPIHCYSSG